MHRKLELDLLPVDSELEITLRSLRKVSRVEKETMADERIDQTVEQEIAAKRPPIQDTMEDFWRPVIQAEYLAIRQPAVEANNFEQKPALITMVQQNQFTGHPTEDPNEHLGRFLGMANTFKLNGVRLEEISNSRAEEKEKTNKKEEKAAGGDNGKSMTERTTKTEKQVQTEQPEKSSEQKQKEKVKAYTAAVPFP